MSVDAPTASLIKKDEFGTPDSSFKPRKWTNAEPLEWLMLIHRVEFNEIGISGLIQTRDEPGAE